MQQDATVLLQSPLSQRPILAAGPGCSHSRSLLKQYPTNCTVKPARQHTPASHSQPLQPAMHFHTLCLSNATGVRFSSSSWNIFQTIVGKHTGGPKAARHPQVIKLMYRRKHPMQHPMQPSLLPLPLVVRQSGLPLHRCQAPSCKTSALLLQAPARLR